MPDVNSKERERARVAMADLDTLAGAARCYPSDEAHSAALVELLARAFAEYREELLAPIYAEAESCAWGVVHDPAGAGFFDIMDTVGALRKGEDPDESRRVDPAVE